MTHRLTTQRMPHARMLLVGAITASISLVGCSKNDEAKDAVSDAGNEFRKVSVGNPNLSDSVSSDAYTSAEQAVSAFAGGDSAYGEAAAVTVALAKLGMANIAGGEASETETVSMHQSRIIRGHLSEWIAMNAVAQASSNIDISDEKAALQELIELRSGDVAQYTKLFESLQEEINTFQSQIDNLNARAISERNEGARFELQMTGVSATQAAQLAEKVREHSLRADGYELESVRLQGKVGQLLPGAHEVELQVKRASDQIELLELSIDELDQRVRDSKTDSAQARANAQQAQSRLKELVEALEDYRQDTAGPAGQKVISLIRQSLTASRDAKKTAKVSGAIAKASANEQLGRAFARLARSEAEMVSLYQSIQDSGIPGDWQSSLEDHQTDSEGFYEESRQAFQSGASALRSIRIRGEAGESLEAAAVRLDRLGGVEPEPEYNEGYESDESEHDESDDEFDPENDSEASDHEG